MQETVKEDTLLARVGLGLAIVILLGCAVALCVKLFSGFTSGGLMAVGLRAQADKGSAPAQYLLGEAYLNGNYGLPKDLSQAKFWLHKAEAQHFAPAGCTLGMLHFAHSEDSISDAQAMQWLEDAAWQRSAPCANTAAWEKATAADAALRDPQGAEKLARSALTWQPGDPGYLDTLAAALAAEGHFDEAVVEQKAAIDTLKRQRRDLAEVNDMQSRLDLYQAGKPYVEEAAAPAASTQPAQPGQGKGQP